MSFCHRLKIHFFVFFFFKYFLWTTLFTVPLLFALTKCRRQSTSKIYYKDFLFGSFILFVSVHGIFTFHVCRTFNLLFEMFSFIIVIVVYFVDIIRLPFKFIIIRLVFDMLLTRSQRNYIFVLFCFLLLLLFFYIYFFSCIIFICDKYIHSNILFRHSAYFDKSKTKQSFFEIFPILNLWKQDTLRSCVSLYFEFHSIIV